MFNTGNAQDNQILQQMTIPMNIFSELTNPEAILYRNEQVLISQKGQYFSLMSYKNSAIPLSIVKIFKEYLKVEKGGFLKTDGGLVPNTDAEFELLKKKVMKEHPHELIYDTEFMVLTENQLRNVLFHLITNNVIGEMKKDDFKAEKKIKKLPCCIKTGVFCCNDCCKGDDRLKMMGIGMSVYYKFIKALILCFLVISLLNIPIILSYFMNDSGISGKTYNDMLFKSTIGNIGAFLYNCQKYDVNILENANFAATLDCKDRVIAGVNNFGISDSAQKETINNEICSNYLKKDELELDNTKCNLIDIINTQIKNTNCINSNTCELSVDLSSNNCDISNDIEKIYLSYICFEKKIKISKWNISLDRDIFGYIAIVVDIISIVIIFITFRLVEKFSKKDNKDYFLKDMRITNFTLHLKDLHIKSKDYYTEMHNLIKHFNDMIEQDDNSEKIFGYNDIDPTKGEDETYKKYVKLDPTKFYIMEIVCPVLTSEKLDMAKQIVDLNDEIMRLKVKYFGRENVNEEYVRRIQFQNRTTLANVALNPDQHTINKKVKNTNKEIAKMEKEVDDLYETMKTIKGVDEITDLYITFRNYNIALYFYNKLKLTKCQRCKMKSCSKSKDKKHFYFNNKLLNVEFAKEEPSTIKWENIHYSSSKRCCRKFVSVLLGIITILITILMALITQYLESDLSEQFNTNIDCNYIKDDESFTNIINEYDNNLPNKERIYSYCYCYGSLEFLNFFGSVLHEKSLPNRNDIKPCKTFVPLYLKYNAISICLSFAIALIDMLVSLIVSLLTSFERNKTLSEDMSGNMWKIFILQFINSDILLLLVNMKMSYIQEKLKKFPLLNGNVDDTDPIWFNIIGTVILSSMIFNIITPHLESLFTVIFRSCSRSCDKCGLKNGEKTKKVLKKDYLNLYVGPYFDIDSRYATTLASLYTTLVFGSGIPFLYVCFFLYLVISYAFDKCMTLRFYRLPPKYDLKMSKLFIDIASFGFVLHFIFGTWIFGNPVFFSNKISSVHNRNILDIIIERISFIPCIILIVVGIVLLIIRIIISSLHEKDVYEEEETNISKKQTKEILDSEEMELKEKKTEFKNVEIGICFPMRLMSFSNELKMLDLFNVMCECKDTEGNKNYKHQDLFLRNVINSINYVISMMSFRMEDLILRRGTNLDLGSISQNPQDLQQRLLELDDERENVLKGDPTYNILFQEDFNTAAYGHLIRNIPRE